MQLRNLILFILMLATGLVAAQYDKVSGNKVNIREVTPLCHGCEEGDIQAMNDCFNKKLIQHVSKQFWYPEEALKKNEQGVVTAFPRQVFVSGDTGSAFLWRNATHQTGARLARHFMSIIRNP